MLTGEQILELQTLVRKVPVTDHVIQYTLALVRQTRVGEPGVPKFVKDWLSWGAGPRAVQNLILGGKARALLYGRAHVTTEDIKALAYPVLRHRILTNFTAASEGITTDTVVKKLLEETPEQGRRPDQATSGSRRSSRRNAVVSVGSSRRGVEPARRAAMPACASTTRPTDTTTTTMARNRRRPAPVPRTPTTIARIARLDLRAQQVVEGFISGMHKSPFFGQ